MRALAAVAGLLVLSACATVDGGGSSCAADAQARTTAELYFGRNIGDAPGVSDADWRAFVDQEVTSRFPDGLTVLDAAGQWRGETGAIAREASKVLMIVLTGREGERADLDAVREAYKRRFRQDAVLQIERQACVGFF